MEKRTNQHSTPAPLTSPIVVQVDLKEEWKIVTFICKRNLKRFQEAISKEVISPIKGTKEAETITGKSPKSLPSEPMEAITDGEFDPLGQQHPSGPSRVSKINGPPLA